MKRFLVTVIGKSLKVSVELKKKVHKLHKVGERKTEQLISDEN